MSFPTARYRINLPRPQRCPLDTNTRMVAQVLLTARFLVVNAGFAAKKYEDYTGVYPLLCAADAAFVMQAGSDNDLYSMHSPYHT